MRYLVLLKNIVKKTLKFISNPIFIFVALQIVWVSLTTLWVVWFINQKNLLEKATSVVNTNSKMDATLSTTILILGCLLLSIVLVGTIFFFILYQRQAHILKQQRNFVSSVTHEFRSPLSSIRLTFDTILSKPVSTEVKEKLIKIIHSDIDRLSLLVEKILVSGKLDKGLFDYKKIKDEFYISDIINNVISQNQVSEPHLEQRLQIKLSQNPKIIGPKLAYEMVIGNILENAIKYSSKKAPIKIIVQKNLFNRLNLYIIDKGYGIPRKEQKKIFKMFYRGEISEKRAISGTGLGLFIAKSTLAKIGGKITVEKSSPQFGTTIKVSIKDV